MSPRQKSRAGEGGEEATDKAEQAEIVEQKEPAEAEPQLEIQERPKSLGELSGR